jgi:N-acetylmuramoyl-L-alanine amidase
MCKFSAVLFILILNCGLAWGQDTGATRRAMNEKIAAELAHNIPVIVSREKWGAKPAAEGLQAHTPTAVILHHTGVAQSTKHSLEEKMRGLQSYSQSEAEVYPGHIKGIWPDVPYHFYIDMAGKTAEGRNINYAGDTNTGYDTIGYVQIVLEGDFEKESPSKEQLTALDNLLIWLTLSWNIPNDRITVHLDHAQTDCPGKNFMSVLPGLRSSFAEHREALTRKLCEEGTKPEFIKMYCQPK